MHASQDSRLQCYGEPYHKYGEILAGSTVVSGLWITAISLLQEILCMIAFGVDGYENNCSFLAYIFH